MLLLLVVLIMALLKLLLLLHQGRFAVCLGYFRESAPRLCHGSCSSNSSLAIATNDKNGIT